MNSHSEYDHQLQSAGQLAGKYRERLQRQESQGSETSVTSPNYIQDIAQPSRTI